MEAEPTETLNTPDDIMADCVSIEAERREWLRILTPLLQHRLDDPPEPRVKYAYDMFYVALCERAARILRSDVD